MKKRVTLSLCMIVKDEERTLERCLNSVKSFINEIIIVDTGSKDKTKEIAKKYTEFVYDFKWIDDFGAAKQFAVSKAYNDNILILDCDEYLQSDKTVLEKLNSMLENEPRRAGRIKCINVLEDDSKNTDWITRAFNRKYYKVEGKIHEQIVKTDGEPADTFLSAVVIKHVGYALNDDEKKKKALRNIKLLKKRLAELEKNFDSDITQNNEKEIPYIYYQLGKSYYMEKDYNNACDFFSKGLSFDLEPKLEYVIDMVETYGYAMLNCGKVQEALSYTSIYDVFGNSADFKFLMGLIYMKNAMFDEAVNEFQKAAEYKESRVEGTNSYLAYYNIGVIYECLGNIGKAQEYYKKCNGYSKAVERLKNGRHGNLTKCRKTGV